MDIAWIVPDLPVNADGETKIRHEQSRLSPPSLSLSLSLSRWRLARTTGTLQ